MNTLPRLLLSLVALAAWSGCASNHSPLQSAATSPITLGSGALLVGATALGAGAGAALAPSKNRIGAAAAGGAVGLTAAAIANNYTQEAAAQAEAEAYERGRRDARVEVMKKYWEEKTLSPQDELAAGGTSSQRTIDYPAGTYEGIRFGPRSTAAPSLEDVRR